MRIIDNKKDYYDYLAGVFGIDGHITFDRRNSRRLVNNTSSDLMYDRYPMGYAQCFCTWKNGVNPKNIANPTYAEDWDKGNKNQGWAYRQSGPGYHPNKSDKFPGVYNVNSYDFNIVIGNVSYMFDVYRVLQNETDTEVKLVPKLRKKFTFDRSKVDCKAPIIIGGLSYNHHDIPWNIAWKRDKDFYDMLSRVGYIRPNRYGEYDENPIMMGTWIPSVIPAEEVWNNITDYLLSMKEPPIIDNRTDVQHLESHGFDKKTSFRNMK